MEKLLACPSAPLNLPIPGQGPVKKNALPPDHRVLVALRYLATPDLISSLALT